MKAIIVGLGSMGKRRIRLLKSIDPSIEILGVDMSQERRQEVEQMGYQVFESIEQAAQEKPQIAFVCTSPLTHHTIIKELLLHKIHTFTELNLVDDGYQEIMDIAQNSNIVLFLSSTMLYRAEINYILQQVKSSTKPLSYIYHIGQYLPDWHPWESYKNFFVGNKRTNGCREILGIELPWIIEAFGEIEDIFSTADKTTELDIDFPDRFFVTITHKSGAKGVLCVDVVCAKAVRNLEIYAENLHIFWEGNPKTLYKFNTKTKQKEFINTYTSFEQDSRYSDNIVENAYVDEMVNFLNVVEGKDKPRYSFKKDIYTIEIMNKIEGIK